MFSHIDATTSTMFGKLATALIDSFGFNCNWPALNWSWSPWNRRPDNVTDRIKNSFPEESTLKTSISTLLLVSVFLETHKSKNHFICGGINIR